MLLAFLLKDGEDFYLCVDVAEFLLSRSTEEKKKPLRTFPFFGCLPSCTVYVEQKTVSPARYGPTQASDVTEFILGAFPTWASTPIRALLPNMPCNHPHPQLCLKENLYLNLCKQVNIRGQTYSSLPLTSVPISCSSPMKGLPCFLSVRIAKICHRFQRDLEDHQ